MIKLSQYLDYLKKKHFCYSVDGYKFFDLFV